ncbi:Calx-beta domain-containing protein, partial [Deltaproteobacteria bacterium TL4]
MKNSRSYLALYLFLIISTSSLIFSSCDDAASPEETPKTPVVAPPEMITEEEPPKAIPAEELPGYILRGLGESSGVSGNTTEAGGFTTFTFKLKTQPASDVVIPLSSSATTEGLVSPSSLVFTSENWEGEQTVTITGVNDDTADGNKSYYIVLGAFASEDSHYAGLDPADIPVTNIDDDTEGYKLSAISGNTTEMEGKATFTIRLNSKPSEKISLMISSSDTTEGNASPESISFTPENWNALQTITVTGVDDGLQDGNQPYTIRLHRVETTSLQNDYNLEPGEVAVVNIDDETAGFTLSGISGNTTESGATATFTLKLNSKPTDDVSLALTSNDPGEGTSTPASLIFTQENWNAEQIIQVTGVDDDLSDGNQGYTVILASATSHDEHYNLLDPSDVSVINVDDETAGFIISSLSGNVTETEGTATFSVKLTSQPGGSVTLPLHSTDTEEGRISPDNLTFTPDNWNAEQTVIITGINDDTADGNQNFTIVLSPAISEDTQYQDLNPVDVSVINIDDETAGFTISVVTSNTTESGGITTFSIKLNSQPQDTVTLPLSSSNENEGIISPASLTFTTTNWNIPQIITITGKDDSLADGNQGYTIRLTKTSSNDLNYNELDPSDVDLFNIDNDLYGFTIDTISGNTNESRGTAAFNVKLTSQPTANVTIAISSSDTSEGTVSPASLIFTVSNWGNAQTVSVTGVDDGVNDGHQAYTVILAPVASVDPKYNGLNPADVQLRNMDNDLRGVTLGAISGNTTETGG